MNKLNIWEKCNIQKEDCKDDLYWIKWEYNTTLERVLKAYSLMEKIGGKFFENKKWVEEYNNLCRNLSRIIKEYKKLTGKELTEKELDSGFKILDFYKIEQENIQNKFKEKYNKEMLKECI